jgi:hypothetical protein
VVLTPAPDVSSPNIAGSALAVRATPAQPNRNGVFARHHTDAALVDRMADPVVGAPDP